MHASCSLPALSVVSRTLPAPSQLQQSPGRQAGCTCISPIHAMHFIRSFTECENPTSTVRSLSESPLVPCLARWPWSVAAWAPCLKLLVSCCSAFGRHANGLACLVAAPAYGIGIAMGMGMGTGDGGCGHDDVTSGLYTPYYSCVLFSLPDC